MSPPLELAGAPVAVCVHCDHRHPCPDHPSGPYYEEPRDEGGSGSDTPYDRERERWRLERLGPWSSTRTRRYAPAAGAAPLDELTTALDGVLLLDDRLRRQLAYLYERRPDQVSRLARYLVANADTGAIRSPEGFLAHKLRELHHDIAQVDT